jgi:hypothetical protein
MHAIAASFLKQNESVSGASASANRPKSQSNRPLQTPRFGVWFTTGGSFVLQELGEHIAHALDCAVAAEPRADPQLKFDNERMARSWRRLARSFQFVESLEQFLIDSQKNRDQLPPKAPED